MMSKCTDVARSITVDVVLELKGDSRILTFTDSTAACSLKPLENAVCPGLAKLRAQKDLFPN